MNPTSNPSNNNAERRQTQFTGEKASDAPSPSLPVWISPFAVDTEAQSLRIGNLFNVLCQIPKDWKVLVQPPAFMGCAYMPSEGNALLRIGLGSLAETNIELVAARPAINLAKHVDIPVVMSIPVHRTVPPVKGHTVSFPAKVPANFLGGQSNDVIDYFQNITVVEIGGHWLSIETSAWGNGCNPVSELEAMQKIHLPFTVLT